MTLRIIASFFFLFSCFKSAVALQGSTACDTAPLVTSGSFETDNSLGDQWYKYIPSSNHRINITSTTNATEVDTYLQLYDACQGEFIVENDDRDAGTVLSDLFHPVVAGHEYYILWKSIYTNQSFDWSIYIESLTEGDLCQAPRAAILGTNTVYNSAASKEIQEWFSYTSNSDGKITITNCGLTSVDTQVSLYDECGELQLSSNDNACSSQSTLVYPVINGEDYYILWENPNDAVNFNWTLSMDALEVGESCTMPATAIEGPNSANHTNGLSAWYTFTATADQNMTLSSCGATANTKVYLHNACNGTIINSSDDDCSTQSSLVHTITNGAEYLIEWSNEKTSGSYDWSLTLEDFGPGEICALAVPVDAGFSYEADHSTGLSEWYSFTPSESYFLGLTTCEYTVENTIVNLYDGCGGNLLASNDDACGTQSQLVHEVLAGYTYYIEWGSDKTSGTYLWEIVLVDLSGGDECATPADVYLGPNYANNATGSEWYSYSTTGTYRVDIGYCSSVDTENEDTEVNVYNSCDGPVLYTADNECNTTGSQLKYIGEGEVNYVIEWTNSKTSAAYEWDFALSALEDGDICNQPLTAIEGTNQATYEYSNDNWFSYTSSHKGVASISSCDLTSEDTEVAIFDTCAGTILTSNDNACNNQSALDYDFESDTNYLIRWSNNSSRNAHEWTLSLDLVGESCDEPILAKNGENYAINSLGDMWFYYIPETDGQLTISTCGLTSRDTDFAVFTTCGGDPIFGNDNGCDVQSSQAGDVTAGETYYIVWYNTNTSSSFQWNIQLSDRVLGQVCSTPLLAISGTNTSNHTSGTSQWYEYTPNRDGSLLLEHDDEVGENTYVRLYDACQGNLLAHSFMECGGGGSCSTEHDLSLKYPVVQNTSYLIEWSNQFSENSYEWNLTLNEVWPGNFCYSPWGIYIGNEVGILGKSPLSEWYAFSTTESGVITISGCETETYITKLGLYHGCDNLLSEVESTNAEISYYVDVELVEKYQIEIFVEPLDELQNDACEWFFNFDPPGIGDQCDNPISATDGTYTASFSNVNSDTRWYEYIPTKDGSLSLSSCINSEDDTYVEIFDLCYGLPIAKNDNSCGDQSELEINIKANERYLIAWSNLSQKKDFEWVLSSSEQNIENPLLDATINTLQNFTIYPNPSNGQITLTLPDQKNVNRISICNLGGKEVMHFNKPDMLENIELNLPEGMYLIQLQDKLNGTFHTEKLMIKF